MCPPVAGLVGSRNGFAGPDAPLEHLVRELATHFARQNVQLSVLARNMTEMQEKLCELSCRRPQNSFDKTLYGLRERFDAIQTASVSSVETKSIVSDWPSQKLQD